MGIQKILISQQNPPAGAGTPYDELIQQYNLTVEYRPFFRVEPLTLREFRAQHLSILDYTAVVFSSKLAIDAFFHLCEETKTVIPDTMKYFCSSENIAVYLQKYIVYRKRKIFYGENSLASVIPIASLPKHRNEKFLVTATGALRESVRKLFQDAKLDCTGVVLVKTVSNDLSGVQPGDYDMVIFYSPADIRSLQENFPGLKAGDTRFATFGPATAKALREAGYEPEIEAPTPATPSMADALKRYLAK